MTSPQASWIGDGWDYDPGHIERRYRPCEDDRKPLDPGTTNPKAPNNTAKKDKTSDLCWVSYNAVMSFGGKTTELVRDAPAGSDPETATEIYRPQNDDGTRVERRVGATNGDNNGEYWVVTTTDGTVHYYGLHEVGGGHAVTDSVSTVPVFGNHPGEPCHEATFAASRCGTGKQQAWRWGLDKVVDVHGNAMVIDWQQATNHYAVKKKFKTPEAYDRGAYPDHIEYGMRADNLTKPSAKVDFVVAERCLASATVCAPSKFDQTGDPGAYLAWWDTPGNLNCKATSDLCPSFPSFWSRVRLSEITTYGQRPGSAALQKTDTYTLGQSFPQDWYSMAPGLWLDSISRKGFGPGDTEGTPSPRTASTSPATPSARAPPQQVAQGPATAQSGEEAGPRRTAVVHPAPHRLRRHRGGRRDIRRVHRRLPDRTHHGQGPRQRHLLPRPLVPGRRGRQAREGVVQQVRGRRRHRARQGDHPRQPRPHEVHLRGARLVPGRRRVPAPRPAHLQRLARLPAGQHHQGHEEHHPGRG